MSEKLLAAVEGILGFVCGALLAALLAAIGLATLFRYAGAGGLAGMEELADWLLPALSAAGLPLALRGPLAMRLDVFGARLPARWSAPREAAAETMTLLSCLALSFGALEAAALLGGVSPLLGLPGRARPLTLAAGGALCLAALALRAVAERRFRAFAITLCAAAGLYRAVHVLDFATPWPPSLSLGLAAALGLVLGTPLPHAFIAASVLVLPFGSLLPEPAVIGALVSGMSRYLLLAIPFFLLAGEWLAVSGLAADLARFAGSLVGHRRGGMAQTVLLTGVLFSGASGSSVANAAFGAATFIPQLTARGYRPERAAAIVAAVATLDNVIPPSIAFLILAAAANLSIGALLAGGFLAGGVMALALALAIHLTADDSTRQPRAPAGDRWRYGLRAIPAFGLGVVVVAGIRLGVVSPTEAAALAALYTLAGALARKRPPKAVIGALRDAAVETAAILLLIGSAAPFASLMATDGVARTLAAAIRDFGANPCVVMFALNAALLLAGLVLDIGAGILLFAPVFLPAAVAAGIDPVHFGVILVVNLMIGGITPPVGILAQVTAGAGNVPAAALFRAVKPYFLALIGALACLALGAALLARSG
ncbi:MAG: TRAP transporter large permease subunit [Candidatus Accumulibacter sp.]|nr:TRAP transporter large permease subunit [Accumulibacter sp.]